MGGGRRHWLPKVARDPEQVSDEGRRLDGRNLIEEWLRDKKKRNLKGEYVWNKQQMDSIDPRRTDYLLGERCVSRKYTFIYMCRWSMLKHIVRHLFFFAVPHLTICLPPIPPPQSVSLYPIQYLFSFIIRTYPHQNNYDVQTYKRYYFDNSYICFLIFQSNFVGRTDLLRNSISSTI